jgi:predicted metal-dependent phosphoesterase TrpH
VKTQFGDVIGLFVENEIKERDFFKLADKIKEQGGLVVLPHPYKKHRLEQEFLERIDLIEAFNSRESKSSNEKAEALTAKLSLPFVTGSDAHFPREIGRGVLKIKKPLMPYNLKEVLLSREKEIIRNYTSICWTVLGQMVKYLKKSKLI